MDHSLDLRRENDSYFLYTSHTHTNSSHRSSFDASSSSSHSSSSSSSSSTSSPPPIAPIALNSRFREVSASCHYYHASRHSLYIGCSDGDIVVWKPKNEFHVEIGKSKMSGHKGRVFMLEWLEGGGSGEASSSGVE